MPTFSNSILSWNSCLNVIILFHCTLGNSPKGLAKLGNIVAEILFPDMFPWVTKLGKIRFESKICVCEAKTFLTLTQKHFHASNTQNVLRQHMFLAQLNWKTLASVAMVPQQCFLV